MVLVMKSLFMFIFQFKHAIENSVFLLQNPILPRFLKNINVQNQLTVSFYKALVCHKVLKVKISPHTHTIFKPVSF